jgi:hypothetical protein
MKIYRVQYYCNDGASEGYTFHASKPQAERLQQEANQSAGAILISTALRANLWPYAGRYSPNGPRGLHAAKSL